MHLSMNRAADETGRFREWRSRTWDVSDFNYRLAVELSRLHNHTIKIDSSEFSLPSIFVSISLRESSGDLECKFPPMAITDSRCGELLFQEDLNQPWWFQAHQTLDSLHNQRHGSGTCAFWRISMMMMMMWGWSGQNWVMNLRTSGTQSSWWWLVDLRGLLINIILKI